MIYLTHENMLNITLKNPPENHTEFLKKEVPFLFSNEIEGEEDLIINFSDKIRVKKAESISLYACFDNENFYLKDKNGSKARIPFGEFDKKPVVIDVENAYSPWEFFSSVFEPVRNTIAVKKGLAFVHSSAAVYKGKGLLFMAFAHSGKTNTVLQILNNGGKYMSDDWTMLSSEGKMYAYPRELNLFHYNLVAFDWLGERFDARLRRKISKYKKLKKRYESTEGLLKKGYRRMLRRVESELSVKKDVRELFPEAGVKEEACIDLPFFVARSSGIKDIETEEKSPEFVAEKMVECAAIERSWLYTVYGMYKFAFPGKSDSLMEKSKQLEKENIIKALRGKTVIYFLIPEGLDDEKRIFNRVRSLIEG